MLLGNKYICSNMVILCRKNTCSIGATTNNRVSNIVALLFASCFSCMSPQTVLKVCELTVIHIICCIVSPYSCKFTHTYNYVFVRCPIVQLSIIYGCLRSCVLACMHACMHACTHICTYVCMYSMYVCLHICIYIHAVLFLFNMITKPIVYQQPVDVLYVATKWWF